MNDPRPTLADLRRVVDVIRSSQHCAALQLELGGIAVEVARDGRAVSDPPVQSCRDETTPHAAEPVVPAPGAVQVESPSVGTFRRHAALVAGGRIEAGATLGDVDVLGELVPVTAATAGRIAAVLIEDGAAVGYRQPVAVLEPGA